jgi:glycine/D-amino acid oxidase-like deaminating enzyme
MKARRRAAEFAAGHTVYAERAVFATNPWCLSLLGLHDQAEGVHTVAVATEPLADAIFDAIGWATRTPFYTLDLPYLWGRVTADGCAVIGGGTTGRGNVDNARADTPDGIRLFESLERRICGLHPALGNVRITHRWMAPAQQTTAAHLTSIDRTAAYWWRQAIAAWCGFRACG